MAANEFPNGGGVLKGIPRRKLGKLLLCGLVLALIPAAYFLTKRPSFSRPQPVMGDDPCDMGFVGLRKDYGDTLFGAQGERLGFDPAVNIFRTHWTQDSLQREFIFEVPVADDSFKMARPVRIYLNGHRGYSPRPRLVRIKSQHTTRFIIDTAMPRLSMRSNSALAELQGGEPVRFVDIEISFYAGPRPPAEIRFIGPFGQGKSIEDELGRGYALRTVFRNVTLNTRELRLYVTAKESTASPSPLILYLADGTSKIVETVGQSVDQFGSGPGATLHYLAPGISREQLTKVTYGEAFWKKTFRGIAVEYQSKGRSCAAYLDAFCERLGLLPTHREAISQRLFQPEYEDPMEALEVLDVVRGRAILPVCNTIRRQLRAADLEPAQRTRVRMIARQWLGTELENEGIALGLWGDWPEFVEPALRQLQWIRFDRDSERDLANSFRFRRQPTAAELHQVADYLTRRKTKSNVARGDLIEFVRSHAEGQAGLDAYQRLVESDRPWVWASLIVADEAFTRLASRRGLSETVKRRALALGVDTGDPLDAVAQDSARAQLAQWISPEFVQKDVEQFGRVMAVLTRHGRPERDTPALVRYLEQQLRLWTAYRPRRGSIRHPVLLHSHVGIEKALKCLNTWHDLNLAGLGRDLRRVCSKDLCDWRNVARSALHWARTGQNPDLLPAGWQPASKDLRIIWHDVRRPEQSRISLWSREGQSPSRRLYHGLELSQRRLLYSLYLEDALEVESIGLTVSAGLYHPTPVTLSFSIDRAKLPFNSSLSPEDVVTGEDDQSGHWLGRWAVSVEAAQSPESVLSGTKLFETWQQLYGQALPTGRPLPRTFSLETGKE